MHEIVEAGWFRRIACACAVQCASLHWVVLFRRVGWCYLPPDHLKDASSAVWIHPLDAFQNTDVDSVGLQSYISLHQPFCRVCAGGSQSAPENTHAFAFMFHKNVHNMCNMWHEAGQLRKDALKWQPKMDTALSTVSAKWFYGETRIFSSRCCVMCFVLQHFCAAPNFAITSKWCTANDITCQKRHAVMQSCIWYA